MGMALNDSERAVRASRPAWAAPRAQAAFPRWRPPCAAPSRVCSAVLRPPTENQSWAPGAGHAHAYVRATATGCSSPPTAQAVIKELLAGEGVQFARLNLVEPALYNCHKARARALPAARHRSRMTCRARVPGWAGRILLAASVAVAPRLRHGTPRSPAARRARRVCSWQLCYAPQKLRCAARLPGSASSLRLRGRVSERAVPVARTGGGGLASSPGVRERCADPAAPHPAQLLDAGVGQLIALAKRYPRVLLIDAHSLVCAKVDEFDACRVKWVKKVRTRMRARRPGGSRRATRGELARHGCCHAPAPTVPGPGPARS